MLSSWQVNSIVARKKVKEKEKYRDADETNESNKAKI